jgi:flagellar biosynthesis protein FlhG
MNPVISSKKIINFSRVLKSRKLKRIHEEQNMTRVIAVTSGKGGVGKTNVVINLGISLSRLGKRVLILDADLGLGNLDVMLGLTPRYNLSHVIHGLKTIPDIIIDGPENVKVIPASSGIEELAQLTGEQRFRMISELDTVLDEVDILLVDTAAGVSSNVIYFNVTAQEIIVVVTPEPTSITDAYALIKILSIKYAESDFKLLVNAAASMQEAQEIYRQLNLIAQRFLGISIEYFGGVLYDRNITRAVKSQKALVDIMPETPAGKCYNALAKKIITTSPPQRDRMQHGSLWNHFCSD